MSEKSDFDITRWIASTDRQVLRAGEVSSAVVRRRFDFGVEKIWSAFTDRMQLGKWLGNVSGDLREGATVKIDVGAPLQVNSKILLCQPQHQLITTWEYGEVSPDHVDQVELRLNSEGEKTLIVLEHRSSAKGDWWFGAGAGWEFALIKLHVLFQGGDPASLDVEQIDRDLGPIWKIAGDA